jgi:hypothetical protein
MCVAIAKGSAARFTPHSKLGLALFAAVLFATATANAAIIFSDAVLYQEPGDKQHAVLFEEGVANSVLPLVPFLGALRFRRGCTCKEILSRALCQTRTAPPVFASTRRSPARKLS